MRRYVDETSTTEYTKRIWNKKWARGELYGRPYRLIDSCRSIFRVVIAAISLASPVFAPSDKARRGGSKDFGTASFRASFIASPGSAFWRQVSRETTKGRARCLGAKLAELARFTRDVNAARVS